MYRGPGATVPMNPGGPATAGPGAALSGPTTMPGGGAGGGTGDLTQWDVWWQLNQAPFLSLKAHVQSSPAGPGGVDGFFLGQGQKAQQPTLRPGEDQVRGEIVPALLAVLERESDNDLVTGALIALAKIGESQDGSDAAKIEGALVRFLANPNQEIRETAAVSFGILASPRALPTLSNLLWDTPSGRELVKADEVDPRTRSFAAYGLGLVGARASTEMDKKLVVSIVRRGLERDDTRSRDLEVSCLVALGLVPLATIDSPAAAGGKDAPPPETSRLAQLEYVFAILQDEKRENLTRAQCPVTLARLMVALPEPHLSHWRERVAGDLVERIVRDKDKAELLQSCVLGLGSIGTNDGKNPLDVRIRATLANVPKGAEIQPRAYALVAAAEVAARPGAALTSVGVDEVKDYLARELTWGKSVLQPWAGLASGIFCWRLAQQGVTHPAQQALQRALVAALEGEKSPERVGAYALGAGLAQAADAAPALLRLLGKELQDDARGQVALALALLGSQEAVEPLRKIIADSKYRPELLRQGAIALAILGDKDVPLQLARMLADAHSLAAQAAIVSALGFIGDRRSVEPLLKLLADRNATEKARAFAAVALGNVADKELLPWNAKIGAGINYRAAPATLFDPTNGTGILDIL